MSAPHCLWYPTLLFTYSYGFYSFPVRLSLYTIADGPGRFAVHVNAGQGAEWKNSFSWDCLLQRQKDNGVDVWGECAVVEVIKMKKELKMNSSETVPFKDKRMLPFWLFSSGDRVPFWPLGSGSGIDFFWIPDPGSHIIFLTKWWCRWTRATSAPWWRPLR